MSVTADIPPRSITFGDDGLGPNNTPPLQVHRRAGAIEADQPEATIEKLFGTNGWGAMWRNGIYDYTHYHATVHEAIGIARGNAVVRFGGDRGTEVAIAAGDVAILPAGTGHQCLSASPDLSVVCASPPGPPMQITRPTPENEEEKIDDAPRARRRNKPTRRPVDAQRHRRVKAPLSRRVTRALRRERSSPEPRR